MTNKEVIERLKLKNWYVTCQNKQESNLVLQACDDAGITWASGQKATEWCPFETYPFDICFFNDSYGISADDLNFGKTYEPENLTDWFFNAIKNNDGNLIPKLTPQNAEQEHYIQILLAKMQGIPVEFWHGFYQRWEDSRGDSIGISVKHRIKQTPTPTPLPVPREMWQFLDKDIRFCAMDKFGLVFFYKRRPERTLIEWCVSNYPEDKSLAYPLYINTDGINWETSLTERPEGV